MRAPERSALCDPCKRGSISERLAPHHNGGVTGASAYASHQFSEFLVSTGPPSVGAVPPGRNKLMPRGEPWLTQFSVSGGGTTRQAVAHAVPVRLFQQRGLCRDLHMRLNRVESAYSTTFHWLYILLEVVLA